MKIKIDDNNYLVELKELEKNLYDYEEKNGEDIKICCSEGTVLYLGSLLSDNELMAIDREGFYNKEYYYKRWKIKISPMIPYKEICTEYNVHYRTFIYPNDIISSNLINANPYIPF